MDAICGICGICYRRLDYQVLHTTGEKANKKAPLDLHIKSSTQEPASNMPNTYTTGATSIADQLGVEQLSGRSSIDNGEALTLVKH